MKRSGHAVWRGGLKDGKGTVSVSLEAVGGGFAVTSSHLETTVRIPGADKAKFEKAVETAKSGCPISKLLNARITMEARLV